MQIINFIVFFVIIFNIFWFFRVYADEWQQWQPSVAPVTTPLIVPVITEKKEEKKSNIKYENYRKYLFTEKKEIKDDDQIEDSLDYHILNFLIFCKVFMFYWLIIINYFLIWKVLKK